MDAMIVFNDGRDPVTYEDILNFEITDGFVILTMEGGGRIGHNERAVRSFALPQTRSAGGVDSRTPTQ